MKGHRWEACEGSASPLGVTHVPHECAYNFSIYSKHAESVELLLYRADDLIQPAFSYQFDPSMNKTGRVWHCRVSAEQVDGAKFYAYRCNGPGPRSPFEMHTFDAEKLLLDPYARSVYFPPGFDRHAAQIPGANDGKAPLGTLPTVIDAFDWQGDPHCRHDSKLLIYELHVGGFTKHPNSGLPDDVRGTFTGVTAKIPYLKELGVTAVELMPIQQFDSSDGNYWGYMPLNFFSPHSKYSRRRKAFHAADIEGSMDVVYNHTCEGDHSGPTYSFKGIDSSTYYLATNDPTHPFANYSGTGNTLHTANRAVRRLIIDSLRYWRREMHVDGFRFDLASIFTRDNVGNIRLQDPPILGQIGDDPELQEVRLIAEPWDAAGGFLLGSLFPGQQWLQWNSRYRETVQRFVRGDGGLIGDLMQRLYGSDDLFPDDLLHSARPCDSVNYVTSHDGFSMYDLVSYDQKNNWANGWDNQDGNHDFHWNHGWEGDEHVPHDVLAMRKQQVKNFCCLLLVSNGTPMFRMGDEFLQTQGGNSNPYNQDNETSWLNWDRLQEHADIFRFFKLMIAFRKAHPSLSRSRFWRSDIRWYGVHHFVDLSESSHSLAFCLDGRSQHDDDLYVMINGYWEPLTFGIFEGKPGQWRRVIDMSLASPDDIRVPGLERPVASPFYKVESRSIVVLRRPRQSTFN